jgi:hypothetical protein
LTAKPDAAEAKRFLAKAIEASGNAMPSVINVDKSPAYPAAVEALKAEGAAVSRSPAPMQIRNWHCAALERQARSLQSRQTKHKVTRPIFYVNKPDVVGMMSRSTLDYEYEDPDDPTTAHRRNTNISVCVPPSKSPVRSKHSRNCIPQESKSYGHWPSIWRAFRSRRA